MDRLWAMEVFVKVVEAGSLSRAATHLDLANASVTTCIRNLETHLGVTLLRRSTRHVSLTEEGSQYYDRCRHILALVETAEVTASPSLSRLQGTLRVELPIAVGHLIIGPALVDFARVHPDLRVIVDLTNGIDNLIRRSVDVAIRMDEIDDGDLIARRIYEARHVLCAAPSFLNKTGLPNHPRDIDSGLCFGFAGMPAAKVRNWSFCKGGENHTIDPGGNLSFNSSDALLRSAARGADFVYVLDVLAREYIQRNEVVTVLQDWETSRQTFYAVYPPSRFISPRVKLFVAFIADLFKPL
jgi:LysR family transcriptional regulator for bpeEF and oprC